MESLLKWADFSHKELLQLMTNNDIWTWSSASWLDSSLLAQMVENKQTVFLDD